MSDAPAVLDTRGLLCPIPVIRTQDRVKALPAGAVLDVLATDPGVLHDIPAWCRVHGHAVLETAREEREIRVRVRVGTPRSPRP
jgi:TusA-related sulfurtransferase